MSKRLEFEGVRGQKGLGLDAAQVSVSSDDQYVYVEEVGGTLQVWSGPLCRGCEDQGGTLRRCVLHQGVQLVARQLELL